MSEELIKKSDAIKAINVYDDTAYALQDVQRITDGIAKVVNAIPTIEPKRGEWLEWIDCEGEVFWKCSACGQASEASVAGILYKFCPFCGTRMKGADDERGLNQEV